MKKIALIHFTYPPSTGGVQTLIQEHAQILTELGYDVTIFAGFGEEKNTNIKFKVIPEFQSVLNFNPKLQNKILDQGIIDDEFYQTANYIEKLLNSNLNDQNIVIVHNMLTIVRNQPFIYAFRNFVLKNLNKKFIAWTHDHSYIYEYKILELSKIANSSLEKELLTTPIPEVSYVVISESLKKPLLTLMHLDQKKTFVIPNGLILDKFLEIDTTIGKLNELYKLINSFPIILSPTNIMERKNITYCLDIISQLKKSYPSIKYVITGSTLKHRDTENYLVKVKKKIEELNLNDNIIFISDYIKRAMAESELHDLYDLADIVFYFSESENFGLPILEAALAKTPIFVSNLEVFHEIGDKNVNFIDYSNTSSQNAAEMIKKYLENDKRIKGHYIARTKYNLKTILQERLVPLLM